MQNRGYLIIIIFFPLEITTGFALPSGENFYVENCSYTELSSADLRIIHMTIEFKAFLLYVK